MNLARGLQARGGLWERKYENPKRDYKEEQERRYCFGEYQRRTLKNNVLKRKCGQMGRAVSMAVASATSAVQIRPHQL